MPQQNVIHIDQVLTNISIAYFNEDYIATDVLPSVPVQKRSDKYFVYGKEHMRIRESRVRPGAIADELDYTLSLNNYQAERRSRRHLVLDAEMQQADSPLSPQADATQLLSENMLGVLELDVANYLTSSANLPNYTALSGTSQWSDYVNSTPLSNIKTAKISVRLNSFKRANFAIIPYDVALTLAEHPSIKGLIQYTDPSVLTESGLPPVIRGLRIIEPGAALDSSVEGRSFTPSAIWGHNVIIGYRAPTVGLKTISLGYVFDAPDETTDARGISTIVYRVDERRGWWIETSRTYDIRVVSTGAAFLFQTVY